MNQRRLFAMVLVAVCIFTLSACRERGEQGSSKVLEGWDQDNVPTIFGSNVKTVKYEVLKTQQASRGALTERPWEDDYWALNEKNLANRYLDRGKSMGFRSLKEQLDDLRSGSSSRHILSPAEKYDLVVGDKRSSLTKDGWDIFNHYNVDYDTKEEWYWMGICHGWALAAYREPTPKHHVLVTTDHTPEGGIIFFEGDIRALLSRAYSTNDSPEYGAQIGTRCDIKAKDIKRDRFGRPVDGAMGSRRKQTNFYIKNSSRWMRQGLLEVVTEQGLRNGGSIWLADMGAARERSAIFGPRYNWYDMETPYKMCVYDYGADNERMAGEDMQRNGRRRLARGARCSRIENNVRFYKVCRDLNAGSFHVILARRISDLVPAAEKESFVIELDRSMEVWNHPVWGFRSLVGDLVAIDRSDPREDLIRDEDATHKAEVSTDLIYIIESWPWTTYDDSRDITIDWSRNLKKLNKPPVAVQKFRYTLEFDKDGFVVGGEWQESGKERPRAELAGTPDFVWQSRGRLTDTVPSWAKNDVAYGIPVKYSLIKKIADCSQKQGPMVEVPVEYTYSYEDDDEIEVTDMGSGVFKAVKCHIP